MDSDQPQIIAFKMPEEWNQWLKDNTSNIEGIWMRFSKKGSDQQPTITYDQALDEALCYGWIDGQVKRYDELSYLQKFTPRRPRSIWSKRNIEHVARLEREGRIKPSGLAAIEAAKADGRWDRAYDSQSNMTVPEDFLKELSKHKQAEAFFKTLNKTNTYAILWRLQTAKKPETRQKRMDSIIAMLTEGKKFH